VSVIERVQHNCTCSDHACTARTGRYFSLKTRLSAPLLRYSVFHSGKVRFGDALPITQAGDLTVPMPFAWHVAKGKDYRDTTNPGYLNGANIINLVTENWPEGKQLKQLRRGYITANGSLVVPETTFRMKTAIDPGTATASEAQLFGYAALQAGQRFSVRFCPARNNTPIRSVPVQRYCTISVVELSLEGSRMTKMIITNTERKQTEMMRRRTREFSRHFSANCCFWSSLSCAFKPLPSARCQSVARASRHGWRWWAVPAQLG